MVKAKKHLGQHFLKEERIAERIADLCGKSGLKNWLEIGPGTGVLTKYLLGQDLNIKCVELDSESVDYLANNYPSLEVIAEDFLRLDLEGLFKEPFGLIGNFPYNISSQIMFKMIDSRHLIQAYVGMFQLEVAQRIAAEHGSKTYGILSVMVQAYYSSHLAFKVSPGCFNPPPKVQSGVIYGERKSLQTLQCDETLFKDIVKTAFGQRRKTLRNSLRKYISPEQASLHEQLFKLRPENLSVAQFVELTNLIT